MSQSSSSPPLPARKKQKTWKTDPTIPIPLKTMQRWEKSDLPKGAAEEMSESTAGKESPESDNSYRFWNVGEIDSQSGADMGETSSSESERRDSNDNYESGDDSVSNVSMYVDDDDVALTCTMNSDDSESDNDSNSAQEQCKKSMLYDGCTKTTDESVFALLKLYIDQNMTKECLKHTLKTVRDMLPNPNEMPKSLYKLFSYVKKCAPVSVEIQHYYCKKCFLYVEISDLPLIECPACASTEGTAVFREIDIISQVKYMFEHRNLADILQQPKDRDPNVISDIIDGTEYVRVNSRTDKGAYDLTLMLSTDGISLKKSSKAELWPLMFMIVEVPEYLRESFIGILGIWYDNCKPLMNTFLAPFCRKLQECFNNDIDWTHPKTLKKCKSRIVAPLIVADAPARATVLNIHNFNGRFGCNICEIKTKKCKPEVGKKRIRIYPYIESDKIILRTGERMDEQGREAFRLKSVIKGVKGLAVVAALPYIDLSTCVIPEYMHSVLLGTVKRFMELWFEKSGHWSVKGSLDDINSFLLGIRPPNVFSRLPRSLTMSKSFKAFEFYTWLLFYSVPAMRNYLPDKYFQHWLLLVMAIFILLQKNIHKETDLSVANNLLKLFVRDVKVLYGDRQQTYNMHQLLHLTLAVRRWGPLWANSAFPFESYNGFMSKFIHGSKHIGQEITNNIIIAQGVEVLRNKVNCRDVFSFSRETIEVIGNQRKLSGIVTERRFLNLQGFNDNDIPIHDRARIRGEIYTSKIYKETKTNSYSVHIDLKDSIINVTS